MTIDHGRIKALFQAAIDREDPAERLEYLDREHVTRREGDKRFIM